MLGNQEQVNENLKAIILIPSYEPKELLLGLLDGINTELNRLEDRGNIKVLIVDDGSGEKYQHIFEEAKVRFDSLVIKHSVNLGKGRALKTGFNEVLNSFPDYDCIVTADSDGQHAPKDIIKCIKEFGNNRESLILGCRSFGGGTVPFRSRFGNELTKKVFGFLCGVHISDTQTGLRVLSTDLVKDMMTVSGERFEYEMNMLIECANKKVTMKEVEIETIYIDNNASSHFNPLVDSIKIYKTFLKYTISSLSSALIDITLFTVFLFLIASFTEHSIFVSTVLARIISSLYNYFINYKVVFEGRRGKGSMMKYYALVVFIMIASGIFTTLLYRFLPVHAVISKMLVDTVLFLFAFFVQREWIFTNVKD